VIIGCGRPDVMISAESFGPQALSLQEREAIVEQQ
jgi:hypothetical protein